MRDDDHLSWQSPILTITFLVDRVRGGEENVISKDLTVLFIVDRRVPHIHRFCCPCPLEPIGLGLHRMAPQGASIVGSRVPHIHRVCCPRPLEPIGLDLHRMAPQGASGTKVNVHSFGLQTCSELAVSGRHCHW